MITASDIKTDLRDLLYLEEEAYNLVKACELSEDQKRIVLDNLEEKQVILSKMIQLFNASQNLKK